MENYRSLAEAILAHGRETPEQTAVYTDGESHTYRELAERIRKVALRLRERGVRAGDRVVVEAGFSYPYVCLCYGTHLSGAVFVPVETNTPDAKLKEIAENTEAALIVTEAARQAFPDGCTLEQLLRESESAEGGADFPLAEDDPVEMLFTTGTTGVSKGVVVSHRNQVTMAKAGIESIRLQADTRWLICSPMNHAGGLRKMHMSMYRGCSTCLLDGLKDLKRLFAFIRETQVTGIYFPPMAIHFLLTLAKKEIPAWDGQLRFIYSSSAVYPRQDKEEMKRLLPHVRMYNVYGGSEVGIVTSLDFNSENDREGSVGRPHSFAKLSILDDSGRVMEHTGPDNYGLLAVESDSVMLGYWHAEELTKSVLKNGRLVTSDYAYIDADGNVILVGRSGDVINIGGRKIAPNEVEETARACPAVDDCMLILSGSEGSPFLKLLVSWKDGAAPDEKGLFELLREKEEPYKVPRRIQTVERIEKTFNGKPDRKKMIALYR